MNIGCPRSPVRPLLTLANLLCNNWPFFGAKHSHRFNDKRDSLSDAKLSKIHGLRNQFQDQRVTGIESYDRAKADMASDTWENEVKGVEMIVSIARIKPEVRRRRRKRRRRRRRSKSRSRRRSRSRSRSRSKSRSRSRRS